jgi:hypothetical protein
MLYGTIYVAGNNKSYQNFQSKMSDIFVQLQESSKLPDRFSYKTPILNLTENLPVGDALIHADRQTDMRKVNACFARTS